MPKLGRLRKIADSELELMLSWRNAPSVRANMYTRDEIALEDHLAWWQTVQNREDQQYFMYESEVGFPSGIVAFTLIDQINANGSWAFYAAPDVSRGTGSKMEFLALEYAFQQLKLHKLHCEVLAFNQTVIKLHQKFGFFVEGVFRQQHKIEAGFEDIYRLGLLKSEWLEKRGVMLKKLQRLARSKG